MFFFGYRNRNKLIKDLRKDMGFTVQQLAVQSGLDKLELLTIDHLKLGELGQPIRSQLMPLLRGDHLNIH